MQEKQEVAGSDLPRAPVLSYITGAVGTPTRVRRVAARATLMVGIVLLGMVLAWGCVEAVRVYELARLEAKFRPMRMLAFGHPLAGGPALPASPTWDDYGYAVRIVLVNGVTVFWGLVALLPGLLLTTMSPGVRRGRAGPCVVSALCLLPYFAILALLTVLLPTAALMPREAWYLRLLVLAVPVGVLMILLLKDLCGFLFWIARHPITEKPRLDFVTGKPVIEGERHG